MVMSLRLFQEAVEVREARETARSIRCGEVELEGLDLGEQPLWESGMCSEVVQGGRKLRALVPVPVCMQASREREIRTGRTTEPVLWMPAKLIPASAIASARVSDALSSAVATKC